MIFFLTSGGCWLRTLAGDLGCSCNLSPHCHIKPSPQQESYVIDGPWLVTYPCPLFSLFLLWLPLQAHAGACQRDEVLWDRHHSAQGRFICHNICTCGQDTEFPMTRGDISKVVCLTACVQIYVILKAPITSRVNLSNIFPATKCFSRLKWEILYFKNTQFWKLALCDVTKGTARWSWDHLVFVQTCGNNKDVLL